jgi:hypothetical protein
VFESLSPIADALHPLQQAAPWLALGTGIAATLVLVVLLVGAVRRGMTVMRALDATSHLFDAHLTALDVHAEAMSATSTRAAGRSEQLAEAVGRLGTSVRALMFLLRSIPDERERLRRAVLDALLPTEDDRREHDSDREPA